MRIDSYGRVEEYKGSTKGWVGIVGIIFWGYVLVKIITFIFGA